MRFGLGIGLTRAFSAEDNSIQQAISSACCDLDATVSDSYTSGQTWSNLVATPADGAGQTDYDAWLGASESVTGAEPTFDTNKFTLDGADHFQIKSFSSATTLYNATRTDIGTNKWWVAIAGKLPASGVDSFDRLYGNADANGTGFSLQPSHSGTLPSQMQFRNRDDGGHKLSGVDTVNNGDTFLAIVSMDMNNSTGNMRGWYNTRVNTGFDNVWNVPNTNATYEFNIGCAVNSTGVPALFMPNGTEIYGFYVGNEYLSDAKAVDIIEFLNDRHSRTYA